MTGNFSPGYDALVHAAGLIDLSKRGRIRVTGEDRARLLHAMCTNHVQQMKPGDGMYAFFLNAQGRILADGYLLCFDDHFLIDTGMATRSSLFAHLDEFIIADDVTLTDITEETFSIGLEGPKAVETAARCGMPAPHHRYAHVRYGEYTVATIAGAAPHGVRIYGPLKDKDEAVASMEAAGAIAASDADAETVRIENFVPRYGIDIDDRTLPPETQQMHALHFQKGCYLGQEIVERIRSRGHVNRLLMGFRIEGVDAAPEPGTKLIVEGQPAGEVTSSAAAGDTAFGLAFVRAQGNKSGAMAAINGRAAALFAPRD